MTIPAADIFAAIGSASAPLTLARAAEGEVAFHAAGAAVLTLPLRKRQA